MGRNERFYFDGSVWQSIYDLDLPWYYENGFYPQIVFNNNILYIIWLDTNWPASLGYVDVAYFDNNTLNWVRPWAPLNYNSIYVYKHHRMAASSDSTLYAAWGENEESQNNYTVYVKKLSGSAWTLVGSAG